MQKNFDITIYGATGFTGSIATRYLMHEKNKDLKIAIAGRNVEKLNHLQSSCAIKPSIVIADSYDSASINQMVQNTKIVLNFAGPFALYGEPIIAACAKFGTDYLDITGETPFISKMIQLYQEDALKSGARLIPFSGFDSIPADLTVFLALKAAEKQNILLDEMCLFYQIKGGFNGGTLASGLTMAENEKGMWNSNYLIPDPSWPKAAKPNLKPTFEISLKRWTVPFFMSHINQAVVRRTNWLRRKLGEKTQHFQYSERLVVPKRLGYLKALFILGTLAAFLFLSKNSWGRKWLRRLGPKPGEGPGTKIRQQGFFKGTLICRNQGENKIIVHMESKGDPGNEITVALACESALLAVKNSFITNLKGFITPSIAFGDLLKERLEKEGFVFMINSKLK